MTTGDYLSSYMEDDDIPDAGIRHMIAQVKTGMSLQIYVSPKIQIFSSELQQTK